MESFEEEDRRRAEKSRQVALFRYSLIQELIDPQLSTRQRGALCRRIAEAEHTDAFGRQVTVTRWTLDRWVRDWRRGGFAALAPTPRRCVPRTPPELLELAVALKKEKPERTAAQIRRILRTSNGWAPTERTLQRHFAERGLNLPAPGGEVFGRFEARHPNDLWTGDCLHGPRIGGRKTYLFAFVDDHSRAMVGHRFGFAEDTVRLAAALRPALASRGVPKSVYVDNGSAFVDTWLLRACATLGIKLVHSTPHRPEGRGKIERLFRTVRDQFLVEFDDATCERIDGLGEMNRLFTAWVETVYHRSIHSETRQAPIERWLAGLPSPLPLPSAAQLHEAFLWSEVRTVTKTATVSLHGNTYQVDPALAQLKVELVFDPFDLTDVEVRHRGRTMGKAVAFRLDRHSHPKARPELPVQPRPDTGIDYLKLVDQAHGRALATGLNYASLMPDADREADR
jgi:putative transposase